MNHRELAQTAHRLPESPGTAPRGAYSVQGEPGEGPLDAPPEAGASWMAENLLLASLGEFSKSQQSYEGEVGQAIA